MCIMLRIAYIISVISILLFISCTPNPVVSGKKPYTDFPQEQELKARTIRLDTALFRYPSRLHIRDGKAVVLDLHGTDYFFIRSATLISVTCLLSGGVEMHRRTCSLLKNFDGMGLFCGH